MRMSQAGAAIMGIWMLWGASWLVAAWWADRTEKRVSAAGQARFQWLTLPAWALLLVQLPRMPILFRPIWHMPPPVGWVLAAGVAAGAGFAWWGRVRLGRLWSAAVTRKTGHRVVDDGAYAIVRHPIYTGLIFAAWCTAAERGTPAVLAAALLFPIGYRVKARIEERFLAAELGPDYDRYRQRVPMLSPWPRPRSRPQSRPPSRP